ncbi:MAG: hypothetical protein V4850_35585 [Myxococcota bacterium]
MIDLVTLARTLHGHLGLLAAIALVHPAITLRPPRSAAASLRPGTRWSVALATALVTITTLGGWWLYPGYRVVDKPRLLQGAFEVAMLFETKEHLAFYALVLAWGGCALVFGPPGGRRVARLCFGASAALAVTVGILGSMVASSPAG